MELQKQTGPTRLISLRGFDNVLIGRDLAGIFTPGKAYRVYELQGVIMFQELGNHAVPKWLMNKDGVMTGKISHYITDGTCMLTEAEYKAQLKSEQL